VRVRESSPDPSLKKVVATKVCALGITSKLRAVMIGPAKSLQAQQFANGCYVARKKSFGKNFKVCQWICNENVRQIGRS
jgi:hypothetical protein